MTPAILQKMPETLFDVTTDRLSLDDVVRAVGGPDDAPAMPVGAVTSFLGLVRRESRGKRVLRLEYESYEPLALKAFERIAAEAQHRWPEVRLSVHHRLGTLRVGEASVAIAAASPHRGEAFAACRYAIERVKQIAPIWKHEFFEDGDEWIEGAVADPDDDTAREAAYQLVSRVCI
jgi:molybdopterin synthase catalytic subunit